MPPNPKNNKWLEKSFVETEAAFKNFVFSYNKNVTNAQLRMSSSPLPCFLVPLRRKYLTQHPVLEHS